MPNPRGQQRDKPFRDALRLEIAAAQKEDNPRHLRQIARKLLDLAADGKIDAIKEVADRMDGKVPQAIVGDEEHDPIQMRDVTDADRAKALAAFIAKTKVDASA